MTGSMTMLPDGQLPNSAVPMLDQQLDNKITNAENPLAGLQGYTMAPAPSDDTSSTSRSSPGNSFKFSPESPTSNYSISPTELDDSKNAVAAPPPMPADATKPRTRSSTATRSQTSKKNQSQPQTQKQKQQQQQQPETATKAKKTGAKAKAGSGRKSQPRNRSLERNRIAASKCRQKKKEWLSDLEANKSRLESQYKSLHGEYNELLDEVTKLKNFLMTHASCNDPNIDGWINNEANTYIRRLSQNVAPQSGLSAAGVPQGNQNPFNDTESLASPTSQASNSISPENSGYSNDYMLDGMFDTDPMLVQPMSVT
ncbi:transcription factor [Lecanicillium sp. MT-2017a]|nr:transcription factor [Lecanicillium sp. MT-2017a]